MSKLLRKPTQAQQIDSQARFERFNLKENPFPSEPSVNKDSSDKRINGEIYEVQIRRKEYEQVETVFLKQNRAAPNHLRLGYIIDTSYIGRGNGKSAFLVNLMHAINKEYCLDISDDINKCFALYVDPEPGGRTKTFASFVDLLFESMIRSGIIKTSLAILRAEAISKLHHKFDLSSETKDDLAFVSNLNNEEWFNRHKLNLAEISDQILQNKYLQDLPQEFPLFQGRGTLLRHFVSEGDFVEYYDLAKRGREKLNVVFSHLVRFFQAAGFNGAYTLVDDFERIPDFQSARQKRDFALELRTCLFDGMYANAKVGFYDFLLVLHAGVPRLIRDAWAESGMENRAPIAPQTVSKHVIRFDKLGKEHASLLLKKYLAEYRVKRPRPSEVLLPFTEGAVSKIGELSEYNAAKILKMAYDLLDKASETASQTVIDDKFVLENRGVQEDASPKAILSSADADSTDLLKKASEQE